MIETATGLVLRTWPLTETSLIVHWLTPGFGRVATVAKGARRLKSPFRGKLDLFYVADFSFSRSRRSELHTLREVTLRDLNRDLRRELDFLRQAAYCANLIERTTETETPLPGVFELMLGLLRHLPVQPPQPRTVLAFELKLLAELGLQPDLTKSQLNPGARQVVNALTKSDWPAVARLSLSEGQLHAVKQFLQGFLVYHVGKVVKGRAEALGREGERPCESKQPGSA